MITHHHFDVTEILSVNEKRGEIYYLATNGDPKQRHLFRKQILNVNSRSECLTCNFTGVLPPVNNPSQNAMPITDGKSCLYHAASFSTDGDYYVLECLGDRIPITFIKNVTDTKQHNYNSSEEDLLKSNLN